MKLYHCCPTHLYEQQVKAEGFVPNYNGIFLANSPKGAVRGQQQKGMSMYSVVEFDVDETEVEKHHSSLADKFCDDYYYLRTKLVPNDKFKLLHTIFGNGGE